MNSQVSIGETLRRRREERGLTAEQASYQSKVPLRLVQALESDDYQLLPDPLYLTGLLRDYARFLGLDVAGLDAEFQQAIQRPPRPLLATPAPRPVPAIQWKQVAWTVAAILVVTPLVLIALSLASRRASDQVVRTQVVEPKAEDAAPVGGGALGPAERVPESEGGPGTPTVVSSGERTADPVAEARAAVPPPVKEAVAPRASTGHVLIARAQEPTWMSVRADHRERQEVLLQAGQTARFEAETSFHVIVGNAGGVTLSLDGTPLPPLGRSGEVVRDLVLPSAGRDSPSSGAALTPPR
jgi:cytoskeleton protein RodZ